MSHYILVSFAFMGWAFYELSDGADFQPPERPQAPVQAPEVVAEPVAIPKQEQLATSSLVPKDPVLAPRRKTRQQKQLEELARQEKLAREAADSRREVLNKGLTGGLGLFTSDLDTTTIAFSTDNAGNSSLVTVAPPDPEPEAPQAVEEPEPDIREVTGTRVNMRDGPGTIYPVVRRLRIGNKVQVIDDSGNGWLRLRRLSDRQVGWVATSFISKKSR